MQVDQQVRIVGVGSELEVAMLWALSALMVREVTFRCLRRFGRPPVAIPLRRIDRSHAARSRATVLSS